MEALATRGPAATGSLAAPAEALPRLRAPEAFGGPSGGAALLLSSSLSVQVAAALASTQFGLLSPGGVAAISITIAALALLARRRSRLAEWSTARWRAVTLLGLTLAANSVLFYLALDHMPLGTLVTIEFLGPLALALGSARARHHVVAVGCALAGVALVSGASPDVDATGLLLALAAATGFAAYILASRRAGAFPDARQSLAVALAIAALLCLPLTVGAATRIDGLAVIAVLVGVAFFGRALPYGLEMLAFRRLRAGQAGVLLSAEPAIGAAVGIVALGETARPLQVVGIALVVGAGALVLRDASV
ncbi:MAG: EamA family transporter [Solirubrobacterales bacterium]